MIYYNIRQKNKIFFFGHRGAPQIIHGNTIKSVCKSIELGCHGIEVDIQITKDKEIILFHDDFIIDKGKKYFIRQSDYKTIIDLCHKNNTPTPPLIDDLINIIKSNNNIVFNIEIKSHAFNNFKIINYILRNIPQETLYNQCIISSFNYFLLYQLHFLFLYKGPTAFILTSKQTKGKKSMTINKILISALSPAFLHTNINNTNQALVDWAHNQSMIINTYTVNDKITLKKCISLGVDGVFTDNHALYS